VFDYKLIFPYDFDDYAWEVESKGCFDGVQLEYQGKIYKLNFYDPIRLAQEIADELIAQNVFIEDNLLVIKSVDRLNIQNAIEFLINSEKLCLLKPISQ
jgi:hypothetical protein